MVLEGTSQASNGSRACPQVFKIYAKIYLLISIFNYTNVSDLSIHLFQILWAVA